MLNEPHNVRLHTQRAILGLYNLKDPPRSPNLSYPGPHWVPDSLHAAWCAAKTLTHCLPPGMPVTYEATCQMLEDGRFMPEQVPLDAHSSIISKPSRQESQCSHKSLRQGSWSASSLQDTIDEIVRNHMVLMDKLAKESKEFQSQMGKTAFLDPAPTPYCSGSASGIAPRNESPCLVVSAGFVEPEHTLKTHCERVRSALQTVSLGMPTVFREQSCRTVLIREPPKGSSLSNDKLSD